MQSPLFRFAVIADSHIEPEPDGACTRTNLRNAAIVKMLNAHKPDFVIHCGDILHVPAFGPHFNDAAAVSKLLYKPLEMPIYSTPGNQDIGDKPSPWMPAPSATPEYTRMYEAHYGPAYQSLVHQDCHFIFINSPIMNSGFDLENEQKNWLDSYLETVKGKRIFLVTHYPVYLLDDHEPGHYDNIDEPARSWLLAHIDRYGIEAVFAGHVHNFFYNQRKETQYYILPSTAFVRRDYSELFHIAPEQEAEFGRNEPAKLGFLLIDVLADGHRAHYVRSYGVINLGDSMPAEVMPSSVFCKEGGGLGVTLRHQWSGITTLTANNTTDEFVRKRVRSDYVLEGIWHLSVKTIRVFMDDLYDSASRERMALMSNLGCEIHIQSVGLPVDRDIQLVTDNTSIVHCWEIVIPADQCSQLLALLARLSQNGVNIAIAKFENSAQYRHEQINYPHFLAAGFHPQQDVQRISALIADSADGAVSLGGIVYRTVWPEDPCEVAQLTREQLGDTSLASILTASWASTNPGMCQADDDVIALYVLKLLAAGTIPGCKVMLDMFSDLDRGYYPRHGIVDRRYDPRKAGQLIRNVHRLFDRLDVAPVFVSSCSDESTSWFAYLKAGDRRVLLSWRGTEGHAVHAWPTWATGGETQMTVMDLQSGHESAADTSWVIGSSHSAAHPAPWPAFLALIGVDNL